LYSKIPTYRTSSAGNQDKFCEDLAHQFEDEHGTPELKMADVDDGGKLANDCKHDDIGDKNNARCKVAAERLQSGAHHNQYHLSANLQPDKDFEVCYNISPTNFF